MFAHARQRPDVRDIKTRKFFLDLPLQPRRAQKRPIRLSGDGKTIGHAHAFFSEMLVHLAERGVLAADQVRILHRNISKPKNGLFVPTIILHKSRAYYSTKNSRSKPWWG